MKKYLLLLLTLVGTFTLQAQVADSYYLPTNITYDPAIPTPQQFLGYQVGEWHVTHDQRVAYMNKLAELSNRITLAEYARTYEQRPLLLLTITNPANHANLENIRTEHLKLTDPAQSGGLKTANMPAVVWMGYSVHGNEPSGANASLLSAYYLAAAQGAEIDSLLRECVILLDPCINPDGGNRFASWVNTHKSITQVSDPAAREYNEVWPGGRTNHYWFDLNRDWLYTQHPESQGRMVKYHAWKPNILTDHHEMGGNSTFFFQPGVASRTHPLTPRLNIDLTAKIGAYHAAELDKIGSYYYTQENYDDFYYGKGSTYPDVNGSIGILFEQASSRGHAQETNNGLLTFPFTIRNQFTATLSTLRAARAMRVELLDYMRDFYKSTNEPVKAYVFGGSNDRARTWEMVNILRRNDIAVHELAKDETLEGRKFPKDNAFVVPLDQSQRKVVKAIFEKRTEFEDSLFYDISAWAMPLTFNVPYVESKANISLGKKLTENPFPAGKVVGKTAYSYLFEWDSYFAPRTLYELQKRGYRTKTAAQPLIVSIDGKPREFDYGTIQIQVHDHNPDSTYQLLQRLAARDGVDFYASGTGLTSSGIDFGSENFKTMRQPKPLMLVGAGVNSNDAGEVWHLLDQRIKVPLTMADMGSFNRLDLSEYNTLILVSGNYGSLSVDKIRDWVRAGGVLIAMTDANEWLAEKGLSTLKLKAIPNDTTGPKLYALADLYQGAQVTGGAIFQVKLDLTHPLAYGYKEPMLNVFRDHNNFVQPIKDPYGAPAIYTDSPLVSGYMSARNQKLIRNSPAIVCNNLGSGKVIALLDNPNFRAFWYGTNKIFLNALFFGSQISSGRFGGGAQE
ncbi:M14 metallopeptidase family protein [Persicitalea jodogahamensis]|uniref:Peptidase M14 n=1 Tax=Persicitalea jodogahamensis TaxID=402147 RepID=A0A8J3DCW9_9BACT|nr:M14 metallopeptidase family protein [Persicitalea jodogahamensis]GHB84381.1 peptidase M14 [Persicitalea jodogahamensis]